MATKATSRVSGILLAVAFIAATPAASGQPGARPANWPTAEEQEALAYLLHAESWADRRGAAEQLRDEPAGAPLRVVPGLLKALAREPHPEPFAEMLITLGSSGAREAWPILRAHLQAENDDVRDAAEEGLELWYLRNGLPVLSSVFYRAMARRPTHEQRGSATEPHASPPLRTCFHANDWSPWMVAGQTRCSGPRRAIRAIRLRHAECSPPPTDLAAPAR